MVNRPYLVMRRMQLASAVSASISFCICLRMSGFVFTAYAKWTSFFYSCSHCIVVVHLRGYAGEEKCGFSLKQLLFAKYPL